MAAFHSDDAFDRLKKLPVVKGKEIVEPNAITKNFRKFRQDLVRRRFFVSNARFVGRGGGGGLL